MEKQRKFIIKQLTYSQALPKIPKSNLSLFKKMIQRRGALDELVDEVFLHDELKLVLFTLAQEDGVNTPKNNNISKEKLINVLHDIGELNYRHVILAYCILPLFEGFQEDWEHCYSASLLLAKLLKRENIFERHNLLLSALIHDLGSVILKKFNPLKAYIVQEYMEHFNCRYDEAEMKIFNVDHGTIGGVMMRFWGLEPDSILPVIYHHSNNVSNKKLAAETFLIQYVNYIDSMVRKEYKTAPYSELLQKISRLQLDDEYYLGYQRELIATLDYQKNLFKSNKDDFIAKNLALFRLPIRQDKMARALAEVATMTISKETMPTVESAPDGGLFEETSTISFVPDQKRKKEGEVFTTATSIIDIAPNLAPYIKNKEKTKRIVEDETQIFKRPKPTKRNFFKD